MSDPREAELLRVIEAQRQRLEEQKKEIEQQAVEIKILRQKLDALARRIFGKSSEKLDANQLELLLKLQSEEDLTPGKSQASSDLDEEADPEHPAKKKKRPFGRKERWPENLPVVVQVIDPEEVAQAPEAWRLIGEEVSEQLDYEPARFFRRRLIRRKYVARRQVDAVPVIAPLPPVLQERCIAGPGLLAQIIVGKFCDHLPLYRQEGIFQSRHRVTLSRQNMARWMGMVADWLKPIYEIIRTGVMGGGYVQVDETPIRYLEPGHGQAKLGYLWTAFRPGRQGGAVFYHWETGRSAACLERIIPVDFEGTLQCDAYSAYDSFARKRPGCTITLAGCWAHTRRGFIEASEQAPRQAGLILLLIRNLYRIEAKLRRQKAGPALRSARRGAESKPIYRRLYKALLVMKASGRYLPSTAMAKAIDYALSNWEALGVYLENGSVEIDDNLVENAIRPTAIGKKNFLFFGEAGAGERGAILYTIVENCRRHGIDPYAYLRDVLTRLPSMTNWQVKEVTPEAWARVQRGQHLAKAA